MILDELVHDQVYLDLIIILKLTFNLYYNLPCEQRKAAVLSCCSGPHSGHWALESSPPSRWYPRWWGGPPAGSGGNCRWTPDSRGCCRSPLGHWRAPPPPPCLRHSVSPLYLLGLQIIDISQSCKHINIKVNIIKRSPNQLPFIILLAESLMQWKALSSIENAFKSSISLGPEWASSNWRHTTKKVMEI